MFEQKFSSEEKTLDDLFHRSLHFKDSKKYLEFLKFIKKFKNYSIFNNTLVFLQNPDVTYYATANHWYRAFNRKIKKDARPMVILAPMTPVLFVYDIGDTEGDPIEDDIFNPFQTFGDLDPSIYDYTLKNCERDKIIVREKKLPYLHAGVAANYRFPTDKKIINIIKAIITINSNFNINDAYATLCHELAHIHLGHLGNDPDKWWPDRRGMSKNTVELEAESVAYLVCGRAGLQTKSDEYLSGYIKDESDLRSISIEWIAKTAALIEKMGKQKLPDRKSKSK